MISLGRLVQEKKCTFLWYPGQNPINILPDGRRLRCILRKFTFFYSDRGEGCVGSTDVALVRACPPDTKWGREQVPIDEAQQEYDRLRYAANYTTPTHQTRRRHGKKRLETTLRH